MGLPSKAKQGCPNGQPWIRVKGNALRALISVLPHLLGELLNPLGVLTGLLRILLGLLRQLSDLLQELLVGLLRLLPRLELLLLLLLFLLELLLLLELLPLPARVLLRHRSLTPFSGVTSPRRRGSILPDAAGIGRGSLSPRIFWSILGNFNQRARRPIERLLTQFSLTYGAQADIVATYRRHCQALGGVPH